MCISIYSSQQRDTAQARETKIWDSSECSMPRKSFCMAQVRQPWPKGCSEGKRSLPITGRGNIKEKEKRKIKI